MKKSLVLMMLLLLTLTAAGCLNGIGEPIKTGDLFLTITDSDGQPLVDAYVIVYGQGSYTDSTGTIEAHGLPVAKHTVAVEYKEVQVASKVIQINEGINSMTLPITLMTLSGYVYDTTGQIHGNSRLYLYDEYGYYVSYGDVDTSTGFYSFVVVPGTYQVKVESTSSPYVTSRTTVTITETLTKDLYCWTDYLPYVDTTGTHTVQWPAVTIGKDVYYQVSVNKSSDNGDMVNFIEEQFKETTANSTTLDTLSPGGNYRFTYRAIDVMTNEVILEGDHWSTINPPATTTPENDVEIMLNSLTDALNNYWSYYYGGDFAQVLGEFISDSYTDNLGRTKADLINDFTDKADLGYSVLCGAIDVTMVDGQSGTASGVWQEAYWSYDYTHQEITASQPVTFTFNNEGTFVITSGVF